ncbi:hypothetical protein RF683_02585 [Flavobacterium sp. 20NA77.7]|uniref:Alpha-L-arabinofuranosidase B catalytic domain-containing protein n=1 Tax=Flavobacterium nakdongensis TaxID=3073563 RepID=A0ABY9RC07_9FLAO|nr:hypothetical protein [Flavobacterium sp. 20NA77.7]WMW78349.1 hypothetical protein RF683_02585 [Flavobacterium sp. 20NA77.7]
MTKYKLIFAFILIQFLTANSTAQVVGTPYIIPVDNRPILDQVGLTPSFAFSTRKLREGYTGPAIRLRRATDNSEIDVAFDSDGVVSGNSIVTLVVVGSSGAALGQTTTLSIYKGANPLYVTIWYDQGANGYNGIQATTARQPVFALTSAGATNQYATLQFTGTSKHSVVVNKSMNTLLTSGIRGSVLTIAKVSNGTSTNNSFGHSDANDNSIRWSAHMNWPDGANQMYTDLGSMEGVRNFLNDGTVGLNKYKQYSIVRLVNSKIVRVSGIDRNNTSLSLTSRTWQANSTFGVGLTTGSLDTSFGQNGFTGNIPEFILYNIDLSSSQFQLLENNQISFWGAN